MLSSEYLRLVAERNILNVAFVTPVAGEEHPDSILGITQEEIFLRLARFIEAFLAQRILFRELSRWLLPLCTAGLLESLAFRIVDYDHFRSPFLVIALFFLAVVFFIGKLGLLFLVLLGLGMYAADEPEIETPLHEDIE